VVLYTRKKKGGHLTPRKIPMTTRLYGMLDKRYKSRDKSKPWVFWGRNWSSKAGGFVEGPTSTARTSWPPYVNGRG
jgi:hypothetical protein